MAGSSSDLIAMYGMVNAGLVDFAEALGLSKEAINESQGEYLIPAGGFELYAPYEDEVTIQLVRAISLLQARPADQVLTAFGEYWVEVFAEKHFAELLEFAGESVVEFIQSLNSIHDRGHALFLGYQPPTFRVEHLESTGDFVVQYLSKREGLEPFVAGLIQGIAKRFNDVAHVKVGKKNDQSGEVEFRVRLAST